MLRMLQNCQAMASTPNEAMLQFTHKLYQQLVSDGRNLFVSPYSIYSAFSMLLLGCRGKSENEVKTLLGDDASIHEQNLLVQKSLNEVSEELELNTANRLFVESTYELLEKFIKDCEQFYGSEVNSLDFVGNSEKSRKTVNDWVDKQTKGKIQDLLQEGAVNAMVRIILVNAIYFKGKWEVPFDKQDTEKEIFFVSTSKHVKVDMMHKKAEFRFNAHHGLGAKILELDYKGREMSMVIVLPNERFGLKDLEDKLTATNMAELTGRFYPKVILQLPKFKMDFECNLVDTFKQLGVATIFENNADLSGISGGKDLFVSTIVHKAFVEVNEEGTEAAAVTSVYNLLRCSSGPRQPTEFICNHPFMFLIKHKLTNTVLFIGRYVNPEE